MYYGCIVESIKSLVCFDTSKTYPVYLNVQVVSTYTNISLGLSIPPSCACRVVHVTALPSAYSSPTTAAVGYNSSHLTLELDVKPSVWRL